MARELRDALKEFFPGRQIALSPGNGQGNHLTFFLQLDEAAAFVRVEDGPEQDDYFDVEAVVLDKIRNIGIPAPSQLGADTARRKTSFAWQVLDRVPAPDLNTHLKNGDLPLERIAEKIGRFVGKWQEIKPIGFGPFQADAARDFGTLVGLHRRYEDYFNLNLHLHVSFLIDRGFLSQGEGSEILRVIATHAGLLDLSQGCLVHKDLALWNVLGTPTNILAVIDWDDAISGDAMDDISLLACFHDGHVVRQALVGYAQIRPLPEDYRRRFWLHLLRNMLVKAVIRVGSGYFDRQSDFFLIGSNSSGSELRSFTKRRIIEAFEGLESERNPCDL